MLCNFAIHVSREKRFAQRPDAYDLRLFRRIFPEEGEISQEDTARIIHYHRFDNTGDNIGEFLAQANGIYDEHIRPGVIGEGNQGEGSLHLMQRRQERI